MKQEERVRKFVRITAFCLQLPLLELLSASDIQGGDKPQKHWPSIRMQLFKHFLSQLVNVNLSGNSSHTSPTITVANLLSLKPLSMTHFLS